MEDQIPPSQPPMQAPLQPQITPEQLAELKEIARQRAIQQTMAQQVAAPRPQPQVVYVRRNLTLAELIVIFALASGIVTGVQFLWNTASNFLPRLEIRVK